MVIQTGKRKVRLSITVDPELKELAEKVADENKTTPSGVISRCLEELAEKRKEQAMISYYLDMAGEDDDYGKKSAKIIEKTVASWNE